ncbi:MAG: hypothetical protein ABI042_07990 [Verrucomicrobiota bacterium]
MKFFLACFAWVFIGAVLGLGIYLFAVKGNPWLLAASAFAFVFAVGKIGCATH